MAAHPAAKDRPAARDDAGDAPALDGQFGAKPGDAAVQRHEIHAGREGLFGDLVEDLGFG